LFIIGYKLYDLIIDIVKFYLYLDYHET